MHLGIHQVAVVGKIVNK